MKDLSRAKPKGLFTWLFPRFIAWFCLLALTFYGCVEGLPDKKKLSVYFTLKKK